jgi:hypothetical protein
VCLSLHHFSCATDTLSDSVGCLDFSTSREDGCSRLAPHTPNCAQARWGFHCALRPVAVMSFAYPPSRLSAQHTASCYAEHSFLGLVGSNAESVYQGSNWCPLAIMVMTFRNISPVWQTTLSSEGSVARGISSFLACECFSVPIDDGL